MGVPNTTTFNLQNVVDYITPSSDDLQTCFDEADSNLFDPTYEGSKNSLLNFRNYSLDNVEINIDESVLVFNADGTPSAVGVDRFRVTTTPSGLDYTITDDKSWIYTSELLDVVTVTVDVNGGAARSGNVKVQLDDYPTKYKYCLISQLVA